MYLKFVLHKIPWQSVLEKGNYYEKRKMDWRRWFARNREKRADAGEEGLQEAF